MKKQFWIGFADWKYLKVSIFNPANDLKSKYIPNK